MTQTHDARRATRAEQYIFRQVKLAEVEYSRKLRKLAQQVQALATEMLKDAPDDAIGVHISAAHVIRQYGDAITPWARIVAEKMVRDVALRDARAWRERSKHIAWGVEDLIKNTPIGHIMQERIDAQVGLITSIPRDVALRVQELAIQTNWTGARYGGIAAEIMKSTDASLARANLIARTEVARTTTEITRARAEFVGSDGYIWRTAGDEDVRPALHLPMPTRRKMIGSHRALEGKFIPWNEPPVSGQRGERAHAGQIYNCFPGEVLAGPVPNMTSVFRAMYSGPIVVLYIGDTALPVTPNHPILTKAGWRAAYQIQPGDQLVKMGKQVFGFVKHDVNGTHARFDKVFEAFAVSAADVETLSIHDFYGDVVTGDVDVVRSANLLKNYRPMSQGLRDYMVPLSQGGMVSAIVGGVLQIREAFIASVLDHCLSSCFIGDRYSGEHALVSVSDRDTGLLQDELYHRAANAEMFSNERGSPSVVVESEHLSNEDFAFVTGKGSQYFSGHVYTSEASGGIYSVTNHNIVVRNCRCIPEVVIPGLPPSNMSWKWTQRPKALRSDPLTV